MAGFEVVDPRYRSLYERAVEVLGADPRVKEVQLSGSIAAGTADAWSDLDIVVVTEPDHHEDLLADRDTWLAAIAPTVFARTPIAPFVINTITDEGLTFDVAVWAGKRRCGRRNRFATASGCSRASPFAELGDALEYAVDEQLRGMAGPFISLLQREEHLRHLTGVPHLLGLLTTVFLAETGSVPPGKQWNGTYTEEQRAAASALPPVSATREGLVAFGLGLAELLITRARPLYPRYELRWPADLAGVTAGRVQEQLGVDTSAWLY